jgi:hypothetical protein
VTLLHQSSQAVRHTPHNAWLGGTKGVNLLLTNSSDAAVGHNKNECLNDLKRKASMELNGVDILNRAKDCGLGCHFGLVDEANTTMAGTHDSIGYDCFRAQQQYLYNIRIIVTNTF